MSVRDQSIPMLIFIASVFEPQLRLCVQSFHPIRFPINMSEVSIDNAYVPMFFCLGWEIETVEDDSLDMTKLIWVNIRLFLLIVASVLMAVLYRKVAITLREKRKKTSARLELRKPSTGVTLNNNHHDKLKNRDEKVEINAEMSEMLIQNSPNKTSTGLYKERFLK